MTTSRFSTLSAFTVLLIALVAPTARADPQVVAQNGDAYVAHNESASTWTVGNHAVAFTVGLASSGVLNVVELRNARMKSPFPIAAAPTTTLSIGGRTMSLGAGGLAFDSFQAASYRGGVRLDLVFTLRDPRVRVTRSYACFTRAPVIETWTTFESLAGTTTLEGLNAWQMTVPAATIQTVSGLLSDDADHTSAHIAHQFTVEHQDVAPGRRLDLGAQGRSSEQTVPWFTTEGADGAFFGALMWSGSWGLSVERTSASMRLTLGVPDTVTTVAPDRQVEAPHGLFGLAPRVVDVSLALTMFVINGIRDGRAFSPLVTYNTWFAYATAVDETSMRDAIDAAARVKADLFVLDAGWYEGAGRTSEGDFTSGLGGYRADPARFPSGLSVLADAARLRAMRFGIWVEPERVSLENVGRAGLDERWLAQRDGRYVPGTANARAAQLCLGDPRARQWLLDHLSALIDEVSPAYLKWDNNFWINCNRAGHGHGTRDGNFAHVSGLYQVLATLRVRYPALLIENVAGGGNRLDFGMLRYSDTAWMDDRTAPSAIVRHNLEGLGQVFPPAYLLSFVIAAENEPLHHDAPDMALYIRSRMPGLLGLTFRAEELDDQDEVEIVQHVDVYKRVADVLRRAAGVRLTGQAVTDAPAWDAMEAVTAAGDAVLFAYQMDPGVARVTLRPYGLRATAAYTVESADAGIIGAGTGESLMTDGIEISQGVASDAHILFVRRARTPR